MKITRYDPNAAKRAACELTVTNARNVDEKTVAERKWQQRKLAPKPQQPCDHGLFSDDHLQLDLVEMLQEPTND